MPKWNKLTFLRVSWRQLCRLLTSSRHKGVRSLLVSYGDSNVWPGGLLQATVGGWGHCVFPPNLSQHGMALDCQCGKMWLKKLNRGIHTAVSYGSQHLPDQLNCVPDQDGDSPIFSGHVPVNQWSDFWGRGRIFPAHRSWNVWLWFWKLRWAHNTCFSLFLMSYS